MPKSKFKHQEKNAILISLIVGLLLMIIKFTAYYLTNSKAILTDAAESIVNVVSAAFATYSVYISSRPKDILHPYGYGKVSFFSSGIEGILIVTAGVLMIFPAILSIIDHEEVMAIDNGLYLVALTMLINGGVGYYLLNKGKKTRSIILEADGKHLLTDAISSMALIVGLFIVKFTQSPYVDGILALILAIFIIYSGIKILKKSVDGLMDMLDVETVTHLIEILNKNRRNEWIDVHNFRVQKYGADIHIDCHITLPYYLSLEQAHDQVVLFEDIMHRNYPSEVEVFIHSDPCLPECCHYCQILDCQVRKEPFTGQIEWTSEKLLQNAKHFD